MSKNEMVKVSLEQQIEERKMQRMRRKKEDKEIADDFVQGMNFKAKQQQKRIMKKHLITELKTLPDMWSKTAKLNHLKRLVEYKTSTVVADTKIDDALKEATAKLMKIDPFASKFIEKEKISQALAPINEAPQVNLTRNLIDSFRKKVKSVKSVDKKSRARSIKSAATMEDDWSREAKSIVNQKLTLDVVESMDRRRTIATEH